MEGTIERFRADFERLSGIVPTPDRRMGLAVSGGADSLALLLLAQASYPGCVAAATVNHELRPEAITEARKVATICASLSVAHEILVLGPSRQIASRNRQDWARRVRYWCLGEWAAAHGIDHIALAHQRDDLAETFLMRAGRGAGVGGLAAMRAVRRNDGPGYRTLIVRPLLAWSRDELAAVVRAGGITSVIDPSNTDPRFDRTRVRVLLASNPDLSPSRLAHAATNLREVEDALEWAFEGAMADHFVLAPDDTVWLTPADLPFELQRRLVHRAIDEVRLENQRFDAWRSTAVAGLTRRLSEGQGGTVADVQARVIRHRWHFRPAPPRRAAR